MLNSGFKQISIHGEILRRKQFRVSGSREHTKKYGRCYIRKIKVKSQAYIETGWNKEKAIIGKREKWKSAFSEH